MGQYDPIFLRNRRDWPKNFNSEADSQN